jgi:hypothetical protein
MVSPKPVSGLREHQVRHGDYSAFWLHLQGDCYDAPMPKYLPDADFRSRRTVLAQEDFAHAPTPELPASDLIDKSTWDGIVALPDDVAVRTSNHHGNALKQLDDLWGACVECVGETQDCLSSAMLEAGDDFQSATYTALTGFYRLSATALRSALELTVIGAWALVCGREGKYGAWRDGKISLSFGQACDGLIAAKPDLRKHLRATVNDSLFDQKTPNTEGGFARRIFDGLSNFTHARPGFADGDIRESNGPIYVRSAFNDVSWMQFETIGLCSVLFLLARQNANIPQSVTCLFEDAKRVRSRVTRAAFYALYHHDV